MLAANAGAAIEMEAEREERIAPLGETRLVRSKRHAYTGAWYVDAPGQHAGVAGLKFFGKEGGSDTYRFELVALGTEEDAWLSEVAR